MPRKTRWHQARNYWKNRGKSFVRNELVRSLKNAPVDGERYCDCQSHAGFYIRNINMRPLIKKGGKP